MGKTTTYTGDVCYRDGWHYAVDGDGLEGERLVCENDGSYRYASDADTDSWHDRKHGQFVTISPEAGGEGVTVSAEEMQAIQAFLEQRRGGQ